ncbi:Transferase [Arabidopsis suecica]|uniref:Transferase n=1 Tax=Arabidopsis suecica TaxID=45249 RepID=A0A8T1Z852_ARASU|nr:Transferase [Arabidopsis suecica]
MDPPLPENYFGVYLSPVQTTTKTGNLLENEFGWAALKLHQAVTEHNGEKISSEMNRWLKSFLKLGGLSSPNIVHMGSSPRFNKYGCEFGMGKAVAVRSGYGGKFDGKILAYPGREGGGSIDLEVCLLPEFMEALESDQEFMSLASSSS